MMRAVWVLAFLAAPVWWVSAEPDVSEADREYINRFHERFTLADPVPDLSEYASRERYDRLYAGEALAGALNELSNSQGGIAWGWSYRMMSLNEMYRATGDPAYLKANLGAIRAVLDVRDDRLGLQLWTGETAPAWGADKYAKRGRAVFAVHTGMIVYPMLDCLRLAAADSADIGLESGEREILIERLRESLAWHDRQYREGPGEGEGHYVGLNQEDAFEDRPLPGNRLGAMGRALWLYGSLTGEALYRERALAIGRYIKNRLILAEDGAYYWPYQLADQPATTIQPRAEINGEDVSHASVTISLPLLLVEEADFPGEEDAARLEKTVTQGFARLNNGVLFGNVTGTPGSNPSLVQIPARWLRMTPIAPAVYGRVAEFYRKYVPNPGPLDLALLIRHRPE